MKIVLLFESKLIRAWLTEMLSGIPCLEIVGTTTNPIAALREIRTLQPAAVFLHAKDRRILGINIAKGISLCAPGTKIFELKTRLFQLPQDTGQPVPEVIFRDGLNEWIDIPGMLASLAVQAGRPASSPYGSPLTGRP